VFDRVPVYAKETAHNNIDFSLVATNVRHKMAYADWRVGKQPTQRAVQKNENGCVGTANVRNDMKKSQKRRPT